MSCHYELCLKKRRSRLGLPPIGGLREDDLSLRRKQILVQSERVGGERAPDEGEEEEDRGKMKVPTQVHLEHRPPRALGFSISLLDFPGSFGKFLSLSFPCMPTRSAYFCMHACTCVHTGRVRETRRWRFVGMGAGCRQTSRPCSLSRNPSCLREESWRAPGSFASFFAEHPVARELKERGALFFLTVRMGSLFSLCLFL